MIPPIGAHPIHAELANILYQTLPSTPRTMTTPVLPMKARAGLLVVIPPRWSHVVNQGPPASFIMCQRLPSVPTTTKCTFPAGSTERAGFNPVAPLSENQLDQEPVVKLRELYHSALSAPRTTTWSAWPSLAADGVLGVVPPGVSHTWDQAPFRKALCQMLPPV